MPQSKPQPAKSKTTIFANARMSMALLWRVAPWGFAGTVGFSLAQVATSLVSIWAGGRVINDLIAISTKPHHDVSLLILDAAVFIGSDVITVVSWTMLSYIERYTYPKITSFAYLEFNHKVASLDAQQFDNDQIHQKINLLKQEGYSWKVGNFAFEILQLSHSIARSLATLVAVMTLAPVYALIIVLASIPAVIAQRRAVNLRWGIWGLKGDGAQLFWKVADLISEKRGIIEMRPQGAVAGLLGRAHRGIDDFLESQRSALRRYLGALLGSRLLESLAVASITISLLIKVVTSAGKFTIGQYSMYIGYVLQFQSSIGLVFGSLAGLFDTNSFMDNYNSFMELAPVINQPENAVGLPKNQPLSIEFDNVSFAYPGTKQKIINNLSLAIAAGDHMALVGVNGAGKTTLIKLLLRFYDVDSGRILVNGTDIREVDLESLYYHVGALFQEFNHYPLSFRENVTIGRSNAPFSQTLYRKSLLYSGADKVVPGLDHGDQTILSPDFKNGTDLSGGQWQKIALARAFYRNADLLILDEPTSAVDAKAEYEIFEQIRQHQADKTTLVVSHRFSTVRQAKRIVVLEEGKIVEDGSHEELLAGRGLYAEMFEKQAEGYR